MEDYYENEEDEMRWVLYRVKNDEKVGGGKLCINWECATLTYALLLSFYT